MSSPANTDGAESRQFDASDSLLKAMEQLRNGNVNSGKRAGGQLEIQQDDDSRKLQCMMAEGFAASLAATCIKALTTTPLNTAELENLPQHMLVQLLGQVVADRDAAHAQLKIRDDELKIRDDQLRLRDDELKKLKRHRYLVDPSICAGVEDAAIFDRVERVLTKWEPRTTAEGWTADDSYYNYHKRLAYDGDAKCFKFYDKNGFQGHEMFQVMSSALLQYRVSCLFAGIYINVSGWNGYKVVWSAEVKHKATGEALGFSEWKGAPIVRFSNMKATKEYQTDVLELLNLLFDDNCPHPYDGTVAGAYA